jgi:hypothetical protein
MKVGRTEAFDEIYFRYWECPYNYAFHNTQSRDVAME